MRAAAVWSRARLVAAISGVCIAWLAPGLVQAESLADAWQQALVADANLASIHSEKEAAEADYRGASRQRLPVLDVTGSYTQLRDSPYLDVQTPSGPFVSPKIFRNDVYASGGVNLSVPLWTSGRLTGSIGAAEAGARAAYALEIRSTSDLKLAVAEAYVAVLRARQALDIATSSVASLQAHVDDVQVMYDKEAVAQSDLLAAKVALANAAQQKLRAANGERLALAVYNRWLGQPMSRQAELEPPAAAPIESGVTLEQMTARALERRPELAAASARQQSLEQQARAERAQGLPQIALNAGYNHYDNQILDRQNFASVGVGLQWRLFDSGQLQARTSALRGRARAARLQLADLRSGVALQVETALLNRDEAEARIKAVSEAVAQAEENARISRELYGSGLGTNTQVLDAETLLLTARNNRSDATYDLLIAGYRLLRAMGEL